VVVTNGHGTSFGANVKFTTPVAGLPPTITKLGPPHGEAKGGTTVKIKGTGFTEQSEVFFGGVPAESVTVKNATQLIVVSPPGSVGPVEVKVTTEAGSSESTPADVFTYKANKP